MSPTLSPRSRQALFTMPALRGLGEAEREHVVGLFRETSLAKGETIYQAGDEADALYLVVAGAVDVVDGTRSSYATGRERSSASRCSCRVNGAR